MAKSRKQIIEERRLIRENENAKILLERAQELGLTYQDHELPPDEVDETKYKKSVFTSLLSMIPYTQAYYEACAAEEEMDNLTKMRIERARANDLLAMTKMGRHEEALSKMMSETNNDFFYFNKLRTKLEAEGKVKIEAPNLNPFKDLERGKNRNRIKKAHRMQFAMIDDRMMKELAAYNRTVEDIGPAKKDAPCTWKGKSKTGQLLCCQNLRMRHPTIKVKDKEGQEHPQILMYCAYHVSTCVNDVHLHEAAVKIKTPNEYGFCVECFFNLGQGKPPNYTKELAPGVVPVSQRPGSPSKGGGEGIENSKFNSDSACTWKPTGREKQLYGFVCTNKVVKDAKGAWLPYCGYHVHCCVGSHLGSSSDAIAVRNELGLCMAHYVAEVGSPPVEPALMLPGLINPRLQKQEMRMKARHWAAPSQIPPEEAVKVEAAVYEDPEPPDDIIEYAIKYWKLARYYWIKRKRGLQSVILIQSVFRRYRVRDLLKLVRNKMALRKRAFAATRIQAIVRRRLHTKIMAKIREIKNKAALVLERVYRGHIARVAVKVYKAACRLQKFMKMLHFFRFRDAVIMIMQLRRMFTRRVKAAQTIQRVFRGYVARYDLFRDELMNFVIRRARRRVCKAIWRFSFVLKKRRKPPPPIPPPTELEIMQLCAKKLSRILLQLSRENIRRKRFEDDLHKSMPPVQRLVRGFLGRAGARKVKFIRKALMTWCNPRFAVEYMKNYLDTKVYRFRSAAKVELKHEMRQKISIVREHLPADERHTIGVHVHVFTRALKSYYESKGVPLLSSEAQLVVKTFQIPATGEIHVGRLDNFISMHPLPCCKHGRMICTQCSYLQECSMNNCECRRFVRHKSRVDGICLRCSHPPSLHRLCPLQEKYRLNAERQRELADKLGTSVKEDSSPLLRLLTVKRDPDVSMPATTVGVNAEEVIIPPKDPNFDRHRDEQMVKSQKFEVALEKQMSMTLTEQLSIRKIEGDNAEFIDDYWQQYGNSMTSPRGGSVMNLSASSCSVKPDTNISEAKFWDTAAKNPNKSVRDYNEKFEHSMPLPVVKDGELLFTFEGPKLYFNILLQIVELEQKLTSDCPEFLRLIVDHIQIFERHWRKMVTDIREGKLDRNVTVPSSVRKAYDSVALPRPHFARRLDRVFRELGFHRKVLGKDIVTQKYAQLRHPKERGQRYGRFSLPTIAMQTASLESLYVSPPSRISTAASGSSTNLAAEMGVNSTHSKLQSCKFGPGENTSSPSRGRSSKLSPIRLELREHSGLSATTVAASTLLSKSMSFDEKPNAVAPSSPLSRSVSFASPPRSSRSNAPSKHLLEREGSLKNMERRRDALRSVKALGDAMKTGALEQLREKQKVVDNRTPSRNDLSEAKRRGSDSDILKDIETHSLQQVYYENETAPRSRYFPDAIIHEPEASRYICPFPACGVSFRSRDATVRHMKTHEQRNRLHVPTPLPDSHLQAFWPESAPWVHHPDLTKRVIPAGSHECSEPGCGLVFNSVKKLQNHMEKYHPK